MHRTTLVRKPNSSTSDLLTWSETPPTDSPATVTGSGIRFRQPANKISKVLHRGQVTEEEARSLEKYYESEGYEGNMEVLIYDLAVIVNATNNLSSYNKLDQGGFGSVYRGILADGQ